MLNFQKMMKQAQEMQFKLQEVQEKLKEIEIEAESGGGVVKVKMMCSGKVTGLDIDASLLETDKETLEDLVIAAINTGNEVKDERVKSETRAMMESMGLPAEMAEKAGGGLPF